MQQFLVFNGERARLVRGAVGAALYDLDGGRVIPLPPNVARFLHQTGDYLLVPCPGPSHELAALVSLLKRNGLGELRGEPPLSSESPRTEPEPFRPDFAWCEVTRNCTLRCSHCYGSFGPAPASAETLSLKQWHAVLQQLREAGFSRIQFIGGEPLLFPGLRELLFEASCLGFSFIEVFSNLLLLDDLILNACTATGARIATTIYSADPAVHDGITHLPGSFDRTVAAVKRSRRWGVPVRMSCIITRSNEGKTGPIQAFIEDLGAVFGGMDQARPSGRGTRSTCVMTRPHTIMGPPFTIGRRTFMQSLSFNPCWYGKIAIADDGAIMPCIFARDCIAGNILKTPARELLTSFEAGRYWRMNKDAIDTCKVCEYRYACPDCRPSAAGWNGGKLDAMTYGCAYDPYSGRMRTRTGEGRE